MKNNLSKKEFLEYIEGYKKEEYALRQLYDLVGFDGYEYDVCYSSAHFLNLIAKLLDDNIKGTKADILYWWAYECDFGTDPKYEPIIYDKNEEILLDTPEKLYDYLVNLDLSVDNNYGG